MKPQSTTKADFDLPKPVITFDTTSAPADELTAEIHQLLHKLNALNIGLEFGKALLNPEVRNNERTTMLYQRLQKEFTSGEGLRIYENHFIKIYREYFSLDELRQINAFYDTPTGKKMITTLPEIMTKSLDKGKVIADYFADKILYEIEQEAKSKNQP